MPTNSQNSSQMQSQGSLGYDTIAEGPVPLPAESPFLSDHGLGASPPPPSPRAPVAPPSDLSPFPPNSAQPLAAQPSTHPGIVGPPPGPAVGSPLPDAISSFTLYGAVEDPYSARSSQAVPRAQAGSGQSELLERLRSITTTTTDSLQGRLVEQYFGIVTAEAIVPTDILMEGAERTGRFGRYKSSQHKLKALEQLVVAELKLEADKLGANAVVGMSLRVSMENGVALVVATGTAVRMV